MAYNDGMMDVAANRPDFTAVHVLDLVADMYGLRYEEAVPLPSDRDQNFLLRGAGLETAVLKIAGLGEDEAVLGFQTGVLLHLAQVAGLRDFVPRVWSTRSGATGGQVRLADGRATFVRLLGYLEGAPLAAVTPHTPRLLWETGHLLGRVDTALADFAHPAMHRELHWDLQHAAATIRQYQEAIPFPEQRALVALFLARYEAEVTPRLGDLRRGIIHSDGNDHNLLARRGAGGRRTSAG